MVKAALMFWICDAGALPAIEGGPCREARQGAGDAVLCGGHLTGRRPVLDRHQPVPRHQVSLSSAITCPPTCRPSVCFTVPAVMQLPGVSVEC